MYNPKSVVYHLGSATMNREEYNFKKIYLTHRNTFITILKNYSMRTWWKILPVKIVLEIVAFLRFLISEPKRALAILRANFDVFNNIIKIIKKNRSIQKFRKMDDSQVMRLMVKRTIVMDYFLFGRKKFSDYSKFIEDY
jgi:GT2 family glycosyltransferase